MALSVGKGMSGARLNPDKPAVSEMRLPTSAFRLESFAKEQLHDDPYVHEAFDESNYLVPQEKADILNSMILGPRGRGKSLLMAMKGTWWTRAFAARRMKNGKQQRVISNIWVREVDEAGPIGYEGEYEFDDETGMYVEVTGGEQVPIPACAPTHISKLAYDRPEWGYNTLILFDEAADFVSNLRPNSKTAQAFGALLRQQRKYELEIVGSTQFVWQLPPGTATVQFDIFIKPQLDTEWIDYRTHSKGRLFENCYDFYSRVIDTEWKYQGGKKASFYQGADWTKVWYGYSRFFENSQTHPTPVSYTHLTLPTICSV